MLVDLIGAIGSPYPFFFGYTLTAILTAVVYALFLYRSNISYIRVLLAEIVINFAINAFLGSFWRVTLYQGSFAVYFFLAVVKNLVLLAPEAFLLCSFLQVLAAPLKQLGILPGDVKVSHSNFSLAFSCIAALAGAVLVGVLAAYYTQVKEFLTQFFA